MDGVRSILEGYLWAAVAAAPKVVIAALVLTVGWWLARTVPRYAPRLLGRLTPDTSLQRLGAIVARVLVFALAVVIAATVVFPDLGVGDLVGVLGLTSVAIGFAFKDIFQNFLAGIIILGQRPFHIGDQIRVKEFEGEVVDIQIRSTVLRTYEGQRVVMPNAELFTNAVLINTAGASRRSTLATGISYGADIEEARQIILEATKGCALVHDTPEPRVFVSGHGESAIELEVLFWTRPAMGSVREAKDQVATAVKYALDRGSIEIPFPQRVLEVRMSAPEPKAKEEEEDRKLRPRVITSPYGRGMETVQ